jgi:chemotaxis signal transduction protein
VKEIIGMIPMTTVPQTSDFFKGVINLRGKAIPVVDLNRCFGCAACATACQQEAILMESKPYFPEPPKTLKDLVVALKASSGK